MSKKVLGAIFGVIVLMGLIGVIGVAPVNENNVSSGMAGMQPPIVDIWNLNTWH